MVGKAIHRYDMISQGDRILVGLSGGKDSPTLIWILHERLPRILIDYELYPVYIDPGFEGGFGESLAAYCKQAGYNLRVEHTDYGLIAHSAENRENPCFLCSWHRRKRLFEIADELDCNKVALGHHRSHNGILCRRNAGFVQQDGRSPQLLSFEHQHAIVADIRA